MALHCLSQDLDGLDQDLDGLGQDLDCVGQDLDCLALPEPGLGRRYIGHGQVRTWTTLQI
jgi:hypothetical protein